jgi:hypothetical protein
LRDHLFNRLRDRKITLEDLYQLELWRESGDLQPIPVVRVLLGYGLPVAHRAVPD